MNGKLKNQVFLVIGAGGGLGKPSCRRLVEEGALVGLAGRNRTTLKNLQKEIDPTGKQTFVLPTDAGNPGEVAVALEACSYRWKKPVGAILIAIGNHIASDLSDPPTIAHAVMQKLWTSMVMPTFNAIHEGQIYFVGQKNGWLINTSSHVVFKDEKELGGNEAYRIAKEAGDIHLRSLYKTLSLLGVRATNLRPATINTPGNEGFLNTPEKRASALQPETIINWVMDHYYDLNPPPDIYFESGAKW